MLINTFGSDKGSKQSCDVVAVSLSLRGGGVLKLYFLSVPQICEPLSNQPLSYVAEHHRHLSELDLADYCCTTEPLEVDMLIGLDHYWKLITGKVIHEGDGPIAMQTRLGWVLSGPVPGLSCQTTCNLVSTHLLMVDAYMPEESGQSLDSTLKKFWDLESLGVNQDTPDVYAEFERRISFKDGRYEVALPWKETHGALSSNYELSLKRLTGLLRRLRQLPDVFQQYDKVIREQLDKGIVEIVSDKAIQNSMVHYLPHHPVVREDKSTTKLRIVYDASAKSNGSSLNDYLYAGPKFGQSIMDILLRFRTHRVALAADIEKAFLMVSVAPHDRDVLRFLWVDDIKKERPRVTTFRFTRVVFGVSVSPFLLNATIKHHVEEYRENHPEFVNLFTRSIYVDDITYGASDEEAAFELYGKSKKVLAEGGFNLRKFVSNSQSLQSRIESSEGHDLVEVNSSNSSSVVEEDKTYTKDVLGRAQSNEGGEQKILGVRWNYVQDQLVFDLSELAITLRNMEPTKRRIVGIGCKFYDPLGFISLITVQFKMLFQDLCLSKIDWDEPLAGELLSKWKSLVTGFHSVMVTIPRCYSWSLSKSSGKYTLYGFCDASSRAYAAVVYMRIETNVGSSVEFVASKTRVSPVERQTIPRLELLSALLLANLMASVLTALEREITFSSITCFTDSKVALYWIRGVEKEWKQFVQNRVIEIRRLVAADCWLHCPGRENPADIPSRGMTPSELRGNVLWRHGPSWLVDLSSESNLVEEEELIMPEACAAELKAVQPSSSHILLSSSESTGLTHVIKLENFSKFSRLLRVTACVLRFVNQCMSRLQKNSTSLPKELTASEVMNAENLWVRESQRDLGNHKNFPTWRMQFGLFLDGKIWRCKGRLGNADISYNAKHPALLCKQHYFTELVVRDAHERVGHNGVKETLTQIRAKFWIIRGRQFVRHILYQCVVCRKLEGPPCPTPPAPSLPEFRVREAPAFTYTGVDFAGPLYVKSHEITDVGKVWICLYTCCVTRAVHLELVPNLTAQTFIRSFKRFTARRGFPRKLVSDNGKTFKAAAKTIEKILNQTEVQQFTAGMGLEWCFNLEKAPWWGGVLERMIKSVKRCLRKTIGRARLTYEELMTALTEVEMIINSRPLSFVSSEDVEEPLTPSHLIVGRRILSLPDSSFQHVVNDSDYNVQVTHDSLSRRMDHLNKVLNHFWKRWKTEYLLQLRECHRYSGNGTNDDVLQEGQVVLMHNESSPRGFGKMVRIHELIRGGDGLVRGAVLKVPSRDTQPTLLRRPLKCLYPLEECCRAKPVENDKSNTVQSKNPQSSAECFVDKNVSNNNNDPRSKEDASYSQVQPSDVRPSRRAAQKANSFIRAVMTEDIDSSRG
ncbi:uncharacterized protein [Dysidea avara]|uniref:uncharacterized protein n=1 Tax=Dysidea avara TaxID=196820 RepID=UPI00331B70BB